MNKKNNSSSKKNIPEPPKRPLSTYFRYIQDNREQFKKKHPEENGKGIQQLLAKEWNSMTEPQLKKYTDLYEKEKAKYEIEKKNYEEKYGSIIAKKREKKTASSTVGEADKKGRKSMKDKK